MAKMQEKGLIERKNGKKNGEWIILQYSEESVRMTFNLKSQISHFYYD